MPTASPEQVKTLSTGLDLMIGMAILGALLTRVAASLNRVAVSLNRGLQPWRLRLQPGAPMVAGALFPMHWDAGHRLVMIMYMQHVERAVLAVPPLATLACWGGLSCSAGPGRHHSTHQR